MLARYAMESDFEALYQMACDMGDEFKPDLPHDRAKFREAFDLFRTKGNPGFFVAEHKRKVIGGLICSLTNYYICDGAFASQEVIYVKPAYRGTMAAVRLIQRYLEWAERLGAREAYMGLSTAYRVKAFGKLVGRFGFVEVGASYRKVLRC